MIAKFDAASIFPGTRGSRSIEISVPGAFTAVGFSGQQKNPGAPAAKRGRPSLFKTIDEDRRERHDHINRSDRSTYPGRRSVLTSGATPEHARAFCQAFFRWYNTVHRHSGIAMMTPHTVHHGHDRQLTEDRGVTLMAAFAAHPERFKGLAPTPNQVPKTVWINPPIEEIAKPTIIIPGSLNTSSLVSQSH